MNKHDKEHNIHDQREEERTKSSFEEISEVLGEGAEPLSIEQLTQELTTTKEKERESWDKFVRTQAEMDNLRKRVERDVANAHRYALEKFVGELLPVLDSFEQGMQHGASNDSSLSGMREGMELTYKMLLAAMAKFGVVQLDPLHALYDPHQHEAISLVPTNEAKPDTVLQVVQKGYTLHGRLVRPARVIVAKAP